MILIRSVEVELVLGRVGHPGPFVDGERVERLDRVVLEVAVGVGQAQGQGFDGIPGQRGLQPVAGGRADVAVERFQRPRGDPVAPEIVVRGQVEKGDVVGEGAADRAAGADLLAGRRGRLEVLVEAAEGVGVVGQLLRAGRQEAGSPAGVQSRSPRSGSRSGRAGRWLFCRRCRRRASRDGRPPCR